ncbi:hypothetical protein EIP91_010362 [Steccherinum ochraceum]|uniref:Protein kinase domain-containing protein n=1 Tax=Steccherinum ochraceum TaxID=92696 RepID=A0A4R0R396_9APHY|nr:hypothetical protein EIP91_010362 [Steccherinum ochraceum]
MSTLTFATGRPGDIGLPHPFMNRTTEQHIATLPSSPTKVLDCDKVRFIPTHQIRGTKVQRGRLVDAREPTKVLLVDCMLKLYWQRLNVAEDEDEETPRIDRELAIHNKIVAVPECVDLVPEFYGTFRGGGLTHAKHLEFSCIIMEYCGEFFTENQVYSMDKVFRDAVADAASGLIALHVHAKLERGAPLERDSVVWNGVKDSLPKWVGLAEWTEHLDCLEAKLTAEESAKKYVTPQWEIPRDGICPEIFYTLRDALQFWVPTHFESRGFKAPMANQVENFEAYYQRYLANDGLLDFQKKNIKDVYEQWWRLHGHRMQALLGHRRSPS